MATEHQHHQHHGHGHGVASGSGGRVDAGGGGGGHHSHKSFKYVYTQHRSREDASSRAHERDIWVKVCIQFILTHLNRRKYRKLKLRFDAVMKQSDDLFRKDIIATAQVKRITEENVFVSFPVPSPPPSIPPTNPSR